MELYYDLQTKKADNDARSGEARWKRRNRVVVAWLTDYEKVALVLPMRPEVVVGLATTDAS